MKQKASKKLNQDTNYIEELIPYFKSILEEYGDEGIIIQGSIFMGKTKRGKDGKFFKIRLEVLRGKSRKEQKSSAKR